MSKYNNKKTKRVIGDEVYEFDSYAEAKEFDRLYSLLRAGKITELKTQPEFLIANAYTLQSTTTKSGKMKVGYLRYTPDFSYIKDGKFVVVEVKGHADTAYKLRKKLFLAMAHKNYGVDEFVEVIRGDRNIYYTNTVKETK